MLRIAWSVGDGRSGTASLPAGARLVLARRMNLPEQEPFAVRQVDGSVYVLVRLPYVSDPALVVTATDHHPVVHRGQRANGAIVELTTPSGDAASPSPGQRTSVTSSGSRVTLRYPDLTFEVLLEFDPPGAEDDGTGTLQLDVAALEHDDVWLVAALAVALSPERGVVSHGDLKQAYARWRGVEVPSDGAFDRNLLRPALESRTAEPAGPRLNKIVLLVDRCRRTSELPERLLRDVRARLDALGPPPTL
ncbi:MAG: hypothetical protein Q7T56_15120 [Nocardioidaceae bacterium]|nr:hypothetical protein [Nocardioidaceae bacterium]